MFFFSSREQLGGVHVVAENNKYPCSQEKEDVRWTFYQRRFKKTSPWKWYRRRFDVKRTLMCFLKSFSPTKLKLHLPTLLSMALIVQYFVSKCKSVLALANNLSKFLFPLRLPPASLSDLALLLRQYCIYHHRNLLVSYDFCVSVPISYLCMYLTLFNIRLAYFLIDS